MPNLVIVDRGDGNTFQFREGKDLDTFMSLNPDARIVEGDLPEGQIDAINFRAEETKRKLRTGTEASRRAATSRNRRAATADEAQEEEAEESANEEA